MRLSLSKPRASCAESSCFRAWSSRKRPDASRCASSEPRGVGAHQLGVRIEEDLTLQVWGVWIGGPFASSELRTALTTNSSIIREQSSAASASAHSVASWERKNSPRIWSTYRGHCAPPRNRTQSNTTVQTDPKVQSNDL